jgi:hypothetical protein
MMVIQATVHAVVIFNTYCCGAHIAFMCFVRISEQTTTFTLHIINLPVFYNRDGERLLRGTH